MWRAFPTKDRERKTVLTPYKRAERNRAKRHISEKPIKLLSCHRKEVKMAMSANELILVLFARLFPIFFPSSSHLFGERALKLVMFACLFPVLFPPSHATPTSMDHHEQAQTDGYVPGRRFMGGTHGSSLTK